MKQNPVDLVIFDCDGVLVDSYGSQAARAVGMRPFGSCGGLTPASRLEGPGTIVFDDLRDLPELLATVSR